MHNNFSLIHLCPLTFNSEQQGEPRWHGTQVAFNMLLGNFLSETVIQSMKVPPPTRRWNTVQLSTSHSAQGPCLLHFPLTVPPFHLRPHPKCPYHSCSHQQSPPGNVGFLVTTCTSSSSSLHPVTSSQAISTFLGICSSNTVS